MICPHCIEFMNEAEDLREKLRVYQDEETNRLADERFWRIRKVFGLTEQPAGVLLALYDAGGKPVSRAWLSDNRIHRKKRDLTNDRSVDVVVCHCRKKLPPNSIDNVWGRGFALTSKGILAVRDALS